MSSVRAQPDDGLDATPSRAELLADAEILANYFQRRLLSPSHRQPDSTATGETSGEASGNATSLHDAFLFGKYGKTPRQAAVLAPLYAREGKPYLLFTQRASGLSRHSGEISFPGGSRDPTDDSLAQTALRESEEELGLPSASVTLLGAMPPEYTVVSNFLVTPYVGWLGEGLPLLRPQESEVAEIIEAPVSALDDHLIYHEEMWSRGGGEAHTVHFYDFGPYRIWGFTGRLLHQLLALLPPHF
ncbi:MAG TPA: CoA pyrophosphatase [Ktedonobacterales bacterium]|jgi:8-oxo-dGTP pyrophosphatase MutT (NUDIX family)|nr:CoA pyrophosphatase [Ktedonobacterales bacterium]